MILAWRWYDPFMWLAFWLFARDLEDRCDEAVIASMQQQQRGHHARSLITCSDACGTIRGPLAFGEINVKERIKRIMNYRRAPGWVTCLGTFALCAAASAC